MSLTQGSPLPNITTTQTQTTQAPAWYNDYLSGLASRVTDAGANAQFVGPTAMQNQAWDLAGQNVGNYQPTLNQATGAVGQATGMSPLGAAQPYLTSAANPTYNTVGNYMSPYINNVVGAIGALGQQNILQNVAPQATAGVVGAGQFGSQRGAQALGQTLNQAALGITAQQANALNTGYQNAMTQALQNAQLQQQVGATAGQLESAGQQNMINAGLAGGQLATTTQNLGLGDVNALSTLGAQQQQIEQNRQLFPLQVAAMQANIMKGFTVPTSVTGTYTGPIPGAYSAAPLSQIMGGASLIGALSKTPIGAAIGSGISNLFGPSSSIVDGIDWSVPNAGIDAGTFLPDAGTDPLGNLIYKLQTP